MAKDSVATNIGAYHFSANKELYEIQRGNNFDFLIDDGLNNILAYGSQTKTFPRAQEFIRLSVAASSVPHFSQDVISVRRGNTDVKYAGPINWGSGTLQCYDFIGAETKDILMAWQALSGNPLTQTVGQQAAYKYNGTLIEYTPDYSQVVRTWKINGCWVSEISEDQFSQDSGSSARRITVTMPYDRAYVEYD